MSTFPLPEAILLEIHQSLGCPRYASTKQAKFATGQASLAMHHEMGQQVLRSIFDTLGLEPLACIDALDNFTAFANAYKFLELNTWTFTADQRQVLWTLLGYFYVPGLARHIGFWNLKQPLDIGMPGGRFWYLPELADAENKPVLHMPVAQVIDWLLDLLGMPLESVADQQSEQHADANDGLRRSLYKWRNETTIRPDTIDCHFADTINLAFEGVFTPDTTLPHSEQFADALAFVSRKKLDAGQLRLQIPMTQPGRLEAVLSGEADEQEQSEFLRLLADRYAQPSMRTIRKRLRIARMVQDGYVRLLNFLCPGVDRRCTDPQQNKLLQLLGLYKFIYNLTVGAHANCKAQGERAENEWFEAHLPAPDKNGLFLSILPSRRETANKELALLLSHHFDQMTAGSELEDHVGLDEQSQQPIFERNAKRAIDFAQKLQRELQLVEQMKRSSPWRALQNEHSFWVVCQVAQQTTLSRDARNVAIQRMRELANSPEQTVQAILMELDGYLNGERKRQPKDTRDRVQRLLDEAEGSEGYAAWKAAVLQFKAKHMLASNEFGQAGKLFVQALEACKERNYGSLSGEIARDGFAVMVANQRLNGNNHEKLYRAMLAGGMMSDNEVIPPIEETARWVSGYFWDDLYKPYPGIALEKRRSSEASKRMLHALMELFCSNDQFGLQSWIKANRKLLASSLPDVDGNSVMMLLIKMHSSFMAKLPLIQQLAPKELSEETLRMANMLEHWGRFFELLAVHAPAQLNITDLKGQTPLMLMAEAGNTELLKVMLQAGADPDLQDWHGVTALHSAIKSRVDSCVDALLDNPCRLDNVTVDGQTVLHTASWTANRHAIERLLQRAPRLAWQRNAHGQTPLELVEKLIAEPGTLGALAEQLAENGYTCASLQQLQGAAALLEQAAPAPAS
ncbi:ankyrin repeat domain-containing protein [Pseudomonas xanthosomatis]|uniref:ankyrin repeat domain-containing protein n=1 Tax=Pseudomonas xanthosomatis TaxID=2842356 RepID=UPI001C3DADF3|nr:ankyrin repeat domain-containing protein [Pseudomonas xanthosomatis]QXH46198.1 ankyrin repeat domain-containing protein [Pseudomonas xanthosomatis]